MKELDYAALHVGDTYRATFAFTEELVRDYVETLGLTYKSDGRVPSFLFAIYKPVYAALGGRIAEGTIHIGQRMEHYREVAVGEVLDVVVTITDKYRKKERDYIVYAIEFCKDGEVCCKQVTTQIWALAETAQAKKGSDTL
jgi:hypothetical protein